MAIPSASTDLYGYKAWRNSLVPFNNGTIFRFMKKYDDCSVSDEIKEGSYWIITGLNDYRMSWDKTEAGKSYRLVACTSTGKLFKRHFGMSVEGIAKWLDEGMVMIVGEHNV